MSGVGGLIAFCTPDPCGAFEAPWSNCCAELENCVTCEKCSERCNVDACEWCELTTCEQGNGLARAGGT